MEAKFSPRSADSDGEAQSAWLGTEKADGLTNFFEVLRSSRLLMASIIVASVAASVEVTMLTPPLWRAEIVVMPVKRNDPASLASADPTLANLGPLLGRADAFKDEALAVLRSRELFDTYSKDKNLLPLLFDTRWDPATSAWKAPGEGIPTLREAYKRFDGIREIIEDRRTGIITLAITWKNREQPVAWARDM